MSKKTKIFSWCVLAVAALCAQVWACVPPPCELCYNDWPNCTWKCTDQGCCYGTCYNQYQKHCCGYGYNKTCYNDETCCLTKCCNNKTEICCHGNCCGNTDTCCDDGGCCAFDKCCVDGHCITGYCRPSFDLIPSGECGCYAFLCEGGITETWSWYCEEYDGGCPSGTECVQTDSVECYTSRTKNCIEDCLTSGSECAFSGWVYAPKTWRVVCGCCD